MHKVIQINYEEYPNSLELSQADQELLALARATTAKAYAPYSNFQVGAAARLSDGSMHSGSNQENASYPVCVCAEHSLFLKLSAMFDNFIVESMAISYVSLAGKSDVPAAPCGKCRQFLFEYEKSRLPKPIRVILSGSQGKVLVVNSIADLLPLSFSAENLGV